MNVPRRRALLRAVGLTALGLTAGCLQDGTPADESTTESTQSSPEPEITTESRRTSDWFTTSDAATTDHTTSSNRQTTVPRRVDDLFLDNETSERRLLDVRVVRGEDASGRVVAAGRYEVPVGPKLELPNVGAVRRRYAVEARVPDGEWHRFDWLVADCEEYHTPTEDPQRTPEDDPTLNADAVVRITDEGVEFGRNECDAIVVSERGAVPTDEYAVGDPATTTGRDGG